METRIMERRIVSSVLLVPLLMWGGPSPRGAQEAATPAGFAGPYKGCAKIFDGKTFDGWEADPSTWSIVEGTMRAAVDGVEITRYTHPDPAERTDPEKRIVPGPIGMFRHGGGASEYKDIFVEANPKEDRLLTVK